MRLAMARSRRHLEVEGWKTKGVLRLRTGKLENYKTIYWFETELLSSVHRFAPSCLSQDCDGIAMVKRWFTGLFIYKVGE